MINLAGKTAVVFGLANKRSIAGASGFQCDVSNDAEIDTLFAALKEKYGKIDTLVHAVAFAPANELRGEFINTSREGFRTAMDVSVYSLIAVSRGALPLMTEGGSIMTMSYYAAEKVVPNYNVMAIATEMMRAHAERAPLHRNVDQLEVGGAALFLASDLSAAITGETLYVDCGYNVMGF